MGLEEDYGKNIDIEAEKDKITQRFSEVLKMIFSSEDIDGIIEELNNAFRHFKRLIKNSDLGNSEIQENIFCEIVKMLNDIYSKYGIRKIWNRIPNLDINDYNDLSLGEQLVHNIYKENWDWVENKKIEGGSCRFWSLMFKKFFDELQDVGLDISSFIFMSKNNFNSRLGHSGVCIKFQGTEYLIDFGEINRKYGNTLIQSIDEINKQAGSENFNKYRSENIGNYDDLLMFCTRESFLEELDKIEIFEGGIIIPTKTDNLGFIRLFFDCNGFSIQSKKGKIFYWFDKNIGSNIDDISNTDLLDYILDNVEYSQEYTNNKLNLGKLDSHRKDELKKFLLPMRGKLNLSKLRKIIKGESFKI